MTTILHRFERAMLGRAPARQLGVVRIVVGVALVLEVLYRIGERGLEPFDPEALHVPYFDWLPVPDPATGAALFAVLIVAGTAFSIGWHTRFHGTVATVALAWYAFADQQHYTNHTYLFILVIAILVLGNAGAALSLDARRRGAAETVEAWPAVLLRAQLVIAYFWAAVQKVNGSFLSGDVLAERATNLGPIAIPDDLPPDALLMALAFASLCAEAFLAFGLWSPRLRPAAFAVAACLHGGILVGMNSLTNSITIFTIQWAALLFLFVDPTPRTVPVAVGRRRWARVLRGLDWLGKLRVDVTPRRTFEAEVDGEPRRGLAGLVAVLEVLPVSFLWAPLLRPAVRWSAKRPRVSPAVGR